MYNVYNVHKFSIKQTYNHYRMSKIMSYLRYPTTVVSVTKPQKLHTTII